MFSARIRPSCAILEVRRVQYGVSLRLCGSRFEIVRLRQVLNRPPVFPWDFIVSVYDYAFHEVRQVDVRFVAHVSARVASRVDFLETTSNLAEAVLDGVNPPFVVLRPVLHGAFLGGERQR